jgi:hypothetical protein
LRANTSPEKQRAEGRQRDKRAYDLDGTNAACADYILPHPPAGIMYKRVTPNFFIVSSIRNDRIWYDRCNRSAGFMNCVMINYPVAEKRRWDDVVTRISHTLASVD